MGKASKWKGCAVVFLMLGCCLARGQKFIDPDKIKQFNITVNRENCTIKTQMLAISKQVPVKEERNYLWYTSNEIIETKGGYDGRLIHGKYTEFYLNNQLKEQGTVSYGLKTNRWKYWYPDGKLKEIIHYRNGIKNGPYVLYNDDGQIMASGRFKKDKLQGKFFTYNAAGKITEKKRYVNGQEVIKKKKAKRKPKTEQKPKESKEIKT